MNWLFTALKKEATRRRFAPNDQVRYFTDPRKGTGNNIVYTPSFSRGKIVDYDQNVRQYRVWNDKDGQEVMVHPRNIVPEMFDRSRKPEPQEQVYEDSTQQQQPQMQQQLQPALV